MSLLVATVLVFLAGLIAVGVNAEVPDTNENCQRCSAKEKECKAPNVGNDGVTRYKIKCCGLYDECALTEEARPSPYCKAPLCEWSLGLRRHESKAYDPEKECCTKGFGPQQKYPIERLYYCTETRTARPGVQPEPNGCGTKNFPVQSKFGKADFTAACNQHDICYDTCKSDKTACNDKFYELMQTECKRAYPVKGRLQTTCSEKAYTYRNEGGIAATLLGAYDDAQMRVCQCCPDAPPKSEINLILPENLDWQIIIFGQSKATAM